MPYRTQTGYEYLRRAKSLLRIISTLHTNWTEIVPYSNATMAQKLVQPVVVSKEEVDSLPILGFKEPGRIFGGFQNIFASESTPTNELTFGIARFPAKTSTTVGFEALHRHTPAEFYYIISGQMYILLEGVEHRVTAGHAIYISGDAEHGFCNPNMEEELVFVWGFPIDGFEGIEYRFSEKQPDWAAIQW